MDQLIGNYNVSADSIRPTLSLTFHTDSLKVKWAHSAAIADLFAPYLVSKEVLSKSDQSANELKHALAYMINELAENAVKFNVGDYLKVSSVIADGEIILTITNGLKPESLEPFVEKLKEITSGDPGDLLIKKIEENALNNGGGSGLGFLTLMSDYGMKLGWKFISKNDGNRILVSSQASMALKRGN